MSKKIISVLLALITVWLCAVPTFARSEEFISEVALVYEDSVEEAREAIKGTDWKLLEHDLNANADYKVQDGVYLIYKTSTNVEDAITDLRVMDMYGGFSISDYERQLAESRAEYAEMVKSIRVIASEFKALYEAGDAMAKLAYRQLNYYKDVKTEGGDESDKLLGDFFLDLPEEDTQIIQILMEGNALFINNLLKILAVGISRADDDTVGARITELQKSFTAEDYAAPQYYDGAKIIAEKFDAIKAKLIRYDALKDQYNLTDAEMDEEEYQFVSQYANLVTLLEKITFGDVTLAAYIRGGNWTIQSVYPIVAAMTEGQLALVELGYIEEVLMYNSSADMVDTLEETLDEQEKMMVDENGKFQTINVYMGVDRSIFNGAFAFTTEAERQQALTGSTWNMFDAALDSTWAYALGSIAMAVDIAMWICFATNTVELAPKTVTLLINGYGATDTVTVTGLTGWKFSAPLLGAAIGFALIAAGLIGITTWYNYYNPSYTEIPAVMVDIKETEAGDKYIKYTAADVFGDDDGRLADFNAYQGKEWNALYYTKDANAGNCLTPNFKFSTTSNSVARRYQGVNMFGETKAYNLNSHVYNADAEGAYLTVRYSNTKKAAADAPDVIGTIIGTGTYVLAAGLGIGAGMGMMSFVNRKKKKQDEVAPAAQA